MYKNVTKTIVMFHCRSRTRCRSEILTSLVYRHRADLLLYFLLMLNVTLEYTDTHLNILGETRSGNPSIHTPANPQPDAIMVVISRALGRKYRTNRLLNPVPVMCESITLSARPQLLPTPVVKYSNVTSPIYISLSIL